MTADFEIITKEEFEEQSYVDPGIQLQICSFCGCCEDPEHCVWKFQCPKCYAPPTQCCTGPDGRIVGLHAERHRYAKGGEI